APSHWSIQSTTTRITDRTPHTAKSLHPTVTPFTADPRAPVQIRTRVYKDQQAALADVEELVQEVTASTGGPPEATGAGSSQARAPAHSAGTSAGTRGTSR